MSLKNKVLTFLAAVKDDPAAALQLLAKDVHWINRLPQNVPFGGEYHGREGVVRYLTQLGENFVLGDYAVEEFDYIETGDTLVMVGCEAAAEVPATGKTFDLDFVWVVRFNAEGQICYLREHNDTAALGEAFRA